MFETELDKFETLEKSLEDLLMHTRFIADSLANANYEFASATRPVTEAQVAWVQEDWLKLKAALSKTLKQIDEILKLENPNEV